MSSEPPSADQYPICAGCDCPDGQCTCVNCTEYKGPQMPAEIVNLIRRCEANVLKFTNDEMSTALHFGEALWHSASANGTEPTYTILQAIDRIVDGLRLEWVDVTEGWYADKNAVRAKTDRGMYRVWLQHGKMWCSFPDSPMYHQHEDIECGDHDHGKQLCLADYRTRFRAELEKAAKS